MDIKLGLNKVLPIFYENRWLLFLGNLLFVQTIDITEVLDPISVAIDVDKECLSLTWLCFKPFWMQGVSWIIEN